MNKTIFAQREFLKDTIREHINYETTEQNRGVPMPPFQKPLEGDFPLIALPAWQDQVGEKEGVLSSLIAARKSVRRFAKQPLTQVELSYLLWATQGIRKLRPRGGMWRNVPSAGNRHTFETYLAVREVADLEKGVYLYRPLEHALVYLYSPENQEESLTDACRGQPFAGTAPVTFIWTTIPNRMEWRYDIASAKVIAIDAGHVCQNLYLAAESISCGTCAIAAYNQRLIDEFVKVDGTDEFVVYIAPVGHLPGQTEEH